MGHQVKLLARPLPPAATPAAAPAASAAWAPSVSTVATLQLPGSWMRRCGVAGWAMMMGFNDGENMEMFNGFRWFYTVSYGWSTALIIWSGWWFGTFFSFSTYWEESSNWLICFDAWSPHAAKSLKQGYPNRQRKTRLLCGRVFLSKIYQKSGYPAVRFIVICYSDFKSKLCLFFWNGQTQMFDSSTRSLVNFTVLA